AEPGQVVGWTPPVPGRAGGGGSGPPVSVAVAPSAMRAATDAAEPPEEPPGTRRLLSPLRRHGLPTPPKCEVRLLEPMANSSMFTLPSMTAPAFHRLAVTVDSYGGLKPSRMCEPAVVCTPSVQNRSLMASAMPSSAPSASPLARRASEAAAML